jgi:hypothetical protein
MAWNEKYDKPKGTIIFGKDRRALRGIPGISDPEMYFTRSDTDSNKK